MADEQQAPQDNSAEGYFRALEGEKREPIEYTGPQDPADFAPPGQQIAAGAKDAADDPDIGKKPGFLGSQAKVVESPDDDKPGGKSRARTK